ncbi:MAG: di-trans,poly-cis-decaprenylcistransferase [Burkholderiales bacterium]|nr:di-trans,poly-cis-decaprenylcistransferase [Burkholderiales bacterium]
MSINHLAIIMDGNRRWATKNNFLHSQGHTEGAKNINLVTKYCIQNNIKYLSLYAFSLENLANRSKTETDFLMKLFGSYAKKHIGELLKHGIRVKFLGETSFLPKYTQEAILKTENSTAECDTLFLNIYVCYGARQELVRACKIIAEKYLESDINLDEINDKMISENLWGSNIPDPDLIIRTGGAKRLSNFLLFQAAYSELYFTDKYWPEFNESDINLALQDYKNRKRNFGS